VGHRSARTIAIAIAISIPTNCEMRTTPYTDVRRLVSPPPKSAAPHAAAAASASAMVAVPAGSGSISP